MSLITDIVLVALIVYFCTVLISNHITKKRMDREEAHRKEQRTYARGSELSLGMVIPEGSTNGEIEEDSKCTLSWYSGLSK